MDAALLGAVTVLTTTNFMGVYFLRDWDPTKMDNHSYRAVENYSLVRQTFAESMDAPNGQQLLSSTTNHFRSVTNTVDHPTVWYMHTEPGWVVRPGLRHKPATLPLLPGIAEKMPRKGSMTNQPGDLTPVAKRFLMTPYYPPPPMKK